jgi:protein-disulfide isomerase
VRGSNSAPSLLVYGDYECPYTRLAYRAIQQIEREAPALVRFVFRHFPLREIHPHAQHCAEAAEGAGAQGRFWELHDLLFHRQQSLADEDLLRYGAQVGLDVDRFAAELESHAHAGRVDRDVESGLASGVTGTPSIFIDGHRHTGSYEPADLRDALEAAAR